MCVVALMPANERARGSTKHCYKIRSFVRPTDMAQADTVIRVSYVARGMPCR